MRSTKIVTSFIRANGKLLILKRSDKVKSMKGLWAGVSGIIEKNEEPLKRAKIEIFEEVGITEDKITLVKAAKEMRLIHLNMKIMSGKYFHSCLKQKIQ